MRRMTDLLRAGKKTKREDVGATEVEEKPATEKAEEAKAPSRFHSALNLIREACSRDEIVPELWRRITAAAEAVLEDVLISPETAMDFILNATIEVESYVHIHMLNLSILSSLIWKELGGGEVATVCAIGMIHDIGIFDLPWDLIHGGPISDPDSRRSIEEHPRHTLRRLEPLKGTIPDEMIRAVYQEHERIDGSGYPEGVGGEEITPLGKIIQVADLFEAITHPRPYREKHMEPFEAMCHIVGEVKEGRLDREVVKRFIDLVSMYPVGSFVELSDGRIGKVISANRGAPFRPRVAFEEETEIIDLMERPDLYIRRQISTPAL
ncbi:HD domain-containing protein [Candidatus Poribacteria bacterium]|nr:HD domain-containing protein [Candidatus Poribacteria bacterium]